MSLRTAFLRHVALLTTYFAAPLLAQDTRTVTEPTFPPTCTVRHAALVMTGGTIGTGYDNDTISNAETATIQAALNACPSGQAVEIAVNASYTAMLLNPLTIPAGVSLIVDGGVTLFATRDPAEYQVSGATAVCGVNGTHQGGCQPFLTFAGANSGLYGYGIIDGRANATMIAGATSGQTWWNQTSTLVSGQYQNIPELISATGNSFTLYKITLRNSPLYHVYWTGNGFTAWGIKIQSPWNIPNTDGLDIWGTNATVNNSIIANGDDQIVIDAFSIPAGNITLSNITGYSRNGISIGSSTEQGVNNVLVENVNLTGDDVSLSGTTVNGMTQATMESTYGLTGYTQALPPTTGHLRGLNIKTKANRAGVGSGGGGSVTNVLYEDICIQDINFPITIQPYQNDLTGTYYPTVNGIHYENIHMLAPTAQMNGQRYQLAWQAYPTSATAGAFSYFILDNVVADDLASGETSLANITSIGSSIKTWNNVYPPILNALTTGYVAAPHWVLSGNTDTLLNASSYPSGTTASMVESKAHHCPTNPFPFTSGELYLSAGTTPTGTSNNLQSATIASGGSVTLNAMVQPAMAQEDLFIANSYNQTPGLLAVGSPALTQPITFFENGVSAGSGTLSLNGTLASLTLSGLATGTYTFTASYPGDSYYGAFNFGSVSVVVH